MKIWSLSDFCNFKFCRKLTLLIMPQLKRVLTERYLFSNCIYHNQAASNIVVPSTKQMPQQLNNACHTILSWMWSLQIQWELEKSLTQHLETNPTRSLISPKSFFYSLCYLLIYARKKHKFLSLKQNVWIFFCNFGGPTTFKGFPRSHKKQVEKAKSHICTWVPSWLSVLQLHLSNEEN